MPGGVEMKKFWPSQVFGFLVLSFMSGSVCSQAAVGPEIPRRQLQYHEHHRIELDGSTISTYRTAAKILAKTAIDDAKRATLSVSRGAQQLQVIEAYTLKPNGRRIQVPRSAWQVRKNLGKPGQPPIFSDHDSTTLVYADLDIGDTVVLAYRLKTVQPLFPGKLALANSFSRAHAYDDVKIVIDAPSQMRLKTQVFDLKEQKSLEGNRVITTWTWSNPTPQVESRRDWSVVDIGALPGYLLSSFEDWDDVARSYVQRASPKAVVSPAVRSLSGQIVGSEDQAREKARLIYNWVATEIGYAGNCVGIGSVVPRDLDVVLKHRLGDCKDHATLLQALLSAQGIESRQVLVNADNLYRLPEVPVAQLVNHVLNYIPAMGLFVDSTDPTTSFGRLPYQLYAKPVLSADPNVPRRIPVEPGGNTQVMKTVMTISDDGSVEGHVKVELGGFHALNSRAQFRNMEARQRGDFVKDMFQRGNLQADGTLELDDPLPLLDTFSYSGRFRVSKAIGFPGTGGLAVSPWFYSQAPALRWGQQAVMPVEDVDSVCGTGSSIEEYEINLPASMEVVAVPKSSAVSTALLSYEASYALEGQKLTVRRMLEDRSPAGICGSAVLREFREATQVVLKDLRQQLLFR